MTDRGTDEAIINIYFWQLGGKEYIPACAELSPYAVDLLRSIANGAAGQL